MLQSPDVRVFPALLVLAVAVALPGPAPAQGKADDAVQPRTPRVVMDRHNAVIGNVLPFDESFLVTGAGGPELHQIDLWYADSTVFSQATCLSRSPPDTQALRLGHAAWIRARGESDTFFLPVDPLPPNRDFTFCVRAVTTPSSADSAAFQQNAAAFLRDSIRAAVSRGQAAGVHSEAELWGLHGALRAALPPADQVVFLSKSTILRPRPDDPGERAVLLAQLNQAFSAYINADNMRVTGASTFEGNRTDFRTVLLRMGGWMVVGVGNESTLVREENPVLAGVLRAAALASAPPQGEAGFAHAVATAVKLLEITPTEAASVANGAAPATHPSMPTGPVLTAFAFSGEDAERRTRNLDETITRLEELRDLVVWLGNQRAILAKAGVSPDSLTRFLILLNAARSFAANQRAQLELIRRALQDFDAAVQQLAATLATRDLTTIGISSTTAANYEARARWYVGPDAGVLYASQDGSREVLPYVAANFYFRPVNKRAPLGGWCFLRSLPCLLRRTSLSVGVTIGKFESENRYTGPIAGRGVYVAPGFRLTDFLRLSYGATLVNTYTPDAERRKRLTAIPTGALSIDFALRDALGGLGSALFGQ